MIITGGMNVYSSEVENIISQIDGVDQVAVVGVPDPDWVRPLLPSSLSRMLALSISMPFSPTVAHNSPDTRSRKRCQWSPHYR